ncbi:redox-regulated ATPase YchF [Candidatus Micrarchaeota archaeon]|nr:redox-regulated ATPase YchF [Candidatus Micrarchaeota archaeon]
MLVGLVGGPNKGKSTLFNALTHGSAAVADYPFTTIDPNKGVAFLDFPCACQGLGVACFPRYGKCVNGIRSVPVNVIDVAGLVPGAHEGKGKGNEFLSDLSQASALVCVADASGLTDEFGNPAPAGYDVSRDVSFVEEELDRWFGKVVARNSQRFSRAKGLGEIEQILSGVGVRESHLQEAIKQSGVAPEWAKWRERDFLLLAAALRKLSKPIVVAANKMDMPRAQENLAKLQQILQGYSVIAVAADLELALGKASEKGLVEYDGKGLKIVADLSTQPPAMKAALERLKATFEKLGTTGVQTLLHKIFFEKLDCIAVFPVQDERKYADHLGRVLPDAILLPKGSTAVDLAGAIHSDLAKGFLYAVDARTKMRMGRDEPLADGSVVKIVSAN